VWGVLLVRGYFIQYKFIVPENVKHSSYTYQKLFRALYGYTQNVTKSSGKTYKYHRKGVLSAYPYIRPGKNCVIIPKAIFSTLIDFFKTGKNPSHKWIGKGDWKATYYMDEKEIDAGDATTAVEGLVDRSFILTTSKAHERVENEISNLLALAREQKKPDLAYKKLVLAEAQQIVSGEWFSDAVARSQRLKQFNKLYNELKGI
jgi:hypothetical protein